MHDLYSEVPVWNVASEETERAVQLLKEESPTNYNLFVAWAKRHQLTPFHEIQAGEQFAKDIWFSPSTRTRFFEDPWLAVMLQADSIPIVALWLGDADEDWAYFATTPEQARLIEARWRN